MDSKTLVETAVNNTTPKADVAFGQGVEAAKLRESLSALMDNEADELELRRVLREFAGNPELSATWQRYHTVRASLHNEIHSNPSVNLLAGINARLAAEDAIHPASTRSRVLRSGLLRYIGQGAIAASVAVAALMSLSLLEVAGPQSQSAGAVAEATVSPAHETPVLNGDYTTTASELARTVSTDPDALDRLEQAVLREFREVREAEELPLNYTPVFPREQSPTE